MIVDTTTTTTTTTATALPISSKRNKSQSRFTFGQTKSSLLEGPSSVMRERRVRTKVDYDEESDGDVDGIASKDHIAPALTPLTATELSQWNGWIEVESEPAFFNAILNDIGVRNARTQEVFTMDDLATLGNKVFGLIFLSEFEDDGDDQESIPEPDNVWFANQTEDNSCATVAMLNILMNCAHAQLGEQLAQLKAATQPFSSVLRGKLLGESAFLRTAHNQFAHRMDILNADLSLDNRVNTDRSGKAFLDKGSSSKVRRKRRKDTVFHFMAYVLAGGEVWELDGLRYKPISLGKIEAGGLNWLEVVKRIIEARMSQDESGNFGLLSLVEDPLWGKATKVAQNLATVLAVEDYLDSKSKTWRKDGEQPPTPLGGGLAAELAPFSLVPRDIETIKLKSEIVSSKTSNSISVEEAIHLRTSSIDQVLTAIMEWQEEKARTMDTSPEDGCYESFLPAIHEWIKQLAATNELQGLNGIANGAPRPLSRQSREAPTPKKKQKKKR